MKQDYFGRALLTQQFTIYLHIIILLYQNLFRPRRLGGVEKLRHIHSKNKTFVVGNASPVSGVKL